MSKMKDLTGQPFGSLTVIKVDKRVNKAQQKYWICKCNCGRLVSMRGDGLRNGRIRQCSICAGTGRLSRFVEESEIQ